MMLITLLPRYRATTCIHPLKPAISRHAEVESHLLSGIPCWFDCSMWRAFGCYALYKVERGVV